MKKLFLLAAAIVAFASAGVAVVSCTNVDEINGFDNGIGNSKNPDLQMQLKLNYETFLDKVIVDRCITSTLITEEPAEGTKRLYFDVSCVEKRLTDDVEDIKTAREIITLVDKGAELSIEDDGTYSHVIDIPEEKCKIALDDMLNTCKKILRSKGVTNVDIASLLEEENADEYALIPLTLGMLELEELQIAGDYYGGSDTISNGVDWDLVKHCAIEAAIGDLRDAILHSMGKLWTKYALKAFLKSVAKRFFGPVGATMFLLDFFICYNGF